eukprot:TRINITY_DN10319_c2_g1_i1.p1 TRINITY_DN10319_c2_g1~~TRINITY_DN10319_c2_g1_i1.p1  ORF type:complete len:900 (+),score=283.43 TRINITY_DN10319_c2_g1_i1:179-2878(+)
MASASAWLQARITSPEDTPADRNRAVVMMIWNAAATFLQVVGASLTSTDFGRVAGVLGVFCHLVFTAVALARRKVTRRMMHTIIVVDGVFIIAFDLLYISNYQRGYPLFVLMLDVLLAVSADTFSKVVVAAVTGWLVVSELEKHYRFGLLDLPGMVPYDARREMCDCEKPPCGTENPMRVARDLAAPCLVFLLDYVLTRRFANDLMAEKERMHATVVTAERIATHLASFDLTAAGRVLDQDGEGLPAALLEALSKLLANLGTYRPYLPGDLFSQDDECSSSSSAAARGRRPSVHSLSGIPGTVPGNERCSIVFTDVRQSTSLWEKNGDVMGEALRTHNAIIREAIDICDGYEVKTIGDAFMVAFAETADAVQFGLRVQEQFAKDNVWPSGLTRPGAEADGFGVFAVRIGVHCGGVTAERNVLTGRYDYFGPTVNKAARVEANGVGGAVVVTREVLDKVNGGAGMADVIVLPYRHKRVAKGLSEPLWLTALLPTCAAGAIEAPVRKVCVMKPPDVDAQPAKMKLGGVASSADMLATSNSVASGGTGSGALAPAPAAAASGLLRGNVRAQGTVGVVRYDGWNVAQAVDTWITVDEERAQRLQMIDRIVRDTRGHLSTVLNNFVLVSWGVHRVCRQQVNEAARFAVHLHGALADTVRRETQRAGLRTMAPREPKMHLGLATGPLASGEVSVRAAQRFVTLLGPSVDLGFALAAAAAELGTFALVAASSVEGEAGLEDRAGVLGPHLRQVDAWSFANGAAAGAAWGGADQGAQATPLAPQEDVAIFELNVATLRQAQQDPLRGMSSYDAPAGWGAAYAALYDEARAEAILALGEQTGDAVLGRVGAQLRAGAHLQHACIAGAALIARPMSSASVCLDPLPGVPLTTVAVSAGSQSPGIPTLEI